MPNIDLYSKKMNELTHVINRLLSLAQQELWDELLLEWPSYDAVTLNLPSLAWEKIPDDERILLEAQLRQIETNHSQLLELTLAWRAELQEILQNTVQSRKLSDHYR